MLSLLRHSEPRPNRLEDLSFPVLNAALIKAKRCLNRELAVVFAETPRIRGASDDDVPPQFKVQPLERRSFCAATHGLLIRVKKLVSIR
jgi:hypothetical protein